MVNPRGIEGNPTNAHVSSRDHDMKKATLNEIRGASDLEGGRGTRHESEGGR